MGKIMKKKHRQPGLPPGTLAHPPEKRDEEVKLTILDYDEYHCNEFTARDFDACAAFKEKPTVTWVHVNGVHHIKTLQTLGNCFDLHPLTLEDILLSDQRTKMEVHENYLFIALKSLSYDDARDEVVTEQVSLVVGRNHVISFQERDGGLFAPVAQRLKNDKSRMRKLGADYLAYTLIDVMVDNYFTVLEKLGERIETLEDLLVKDPNPVILQSVHRLRSEMIALRKAVWPLREVVSALSRSDNTIIGESINIYLRDVYDHTIQVIDTIEIYRDVLAGMIDVYLSSVSNRLNAVMKVLTIISTIFMPLTFIAGVYGMNFKHMPELEWPWAYPLVLTLMLLIGLSMLSFFKAKKWL